jgi:hypothetical protein
MVTTDDLRTVLESTSDRRTAEALLAAGVVPGDVPDPLKRRFDGVDDRLIAAWVGADIPVSCAVFAALYADSAELCHRILCADERSKVRLALAANPNLSADDVQTLFVRDGKEGSGYAQRVQSAILAVSPHHAAVVAAIAADVAEWKAPLPPLSQYVRRAVADGAADVVAKLSPVCPIAVAQGFVEAMFDGALTISSMLDLLSGDAAERAVERLFSPSSPDTDPVLADGELLCRLLAEFPKQLRDSMMRPIGSRSVLPVTFDEPATRSLLQFFTTCSSFSVGTVAAHVIMFNPWMVEHAELTVDLLASPTSATSAAASLLRRQDLPMRSAARLVRMFARPEKHATFGDTVVAALAFPELDQEMVDAVAEVLEVAWVSSASLPSSMLLRALSDAVCGPLVDRSRMRALFDQWALAPAHAPNEWLLQCAAAVWAAPSVLEWRWPLLLSTSSGRDLLVGELARVLADDDPSVLLTVWSLLCDRAEELSSGTVPSVPLSDVVGAVRALV